MPDVSRARNRRTARLTRVDLDGVEFDLFENGERLRAVRVDVGNGTTWRRAVRFPALRCADGESTGDDELDWEIRERAAEELVRLEAATAALTAAASRLFGDGLSDERRPGLIARAFERAEDGAA